MPRSTTKDAPTDTAESVRAETMKSASEGAPKLDVASLLGDIRTEEVRDTQPMMTPPSEPAVEVQAEGITAWHNGKKITAMWANSASRNSYAAVAGLGWRKLSNANDSTYLSMVMMASHAEQTNSTVNLEISASNEITQIYVW
ncbi:hypothetical protein SAMN05421688_1936 [Poseidonocella pacifica]|uniref:Uncharacterized protein n=1 Tax=Poseidonocella pacifica TaxID=871651 RepID=A0A1I0X6C4_9RHOB|nr:hypothetical protein [Poseidonocella pacifica]SFA96612.1 hypothetical protein SAMN05421688_1936 [Poseidonocella pacifica]